MVTDAATYRYTATPTITQRAAGLLTQPTYTVYKNKKKIRPPARISSKISDDKQLIFFTRPNQRLYQDENRQKNQTYENFTKTQAHHSTIIYMRILQKHKLTIVRSPRLAPPYLDKKNRVEV